MTDKEFNDILDQHLQLEYDGKTLIVQYGHRCVAIDISSKIHSKYSAYVDCFWWADQYRRCSKQLEKWQGTEETFYYAWQCYDAIKNVMPYQVQIACERKLNYL